MSGWWEVYLLGYLKKLVDKRNNSCYHSICKHFHHANFSALPGEFEPSQKAPTVKVGERVRITMYKNIFSIGYTEKLSKKLFNWFYVWN